jgi:hypothetical protein
VELLLIPLFIALIVVPFYFLGKHRPQNSTESVAGKIEKEPEPIAEPRRQDSTESAPRRMTQEPAASDTSTSKQSRFKFCINCGAEAILAAKFCGECGAKVYRGEVQQQPANASVSRPSETPVEPPVSVESVVESHSKAADVLATRGFQVEAPSVSKPVQPTPKIEGQSTTNRWFTGVLRWGIGIVSFVVVASVLRLIHPVLPGIVIESAAGPLLTQAVLWWLWKKDYRGKTDRSLSVEWPSNLIGCSITVIGSGIVRFVYLSGFVEPGLRSQGIDNSSELGVFFNFGVPALIAIPICMYWEKRSW